MTEQTTQNKQTFLQDGIRLQWIIDEFIPHRCGGRQALEGSSTKEVREEFIQNETSEAKVSYAELLRQQENQASSCIDKPNVLVSHVNSYTFLDTIDTLVRHHRTELEKIVVWWDLFSINYHTDHQWDSDWLTTSLKEEVGTIGRVVMVTRPWNDPLPYRDAWCVFMAYCALTSEKPVSLEVALSEKEYKQFVSDVHSIRNEAAVNKMLSEVRKDRIGSEKADDKEKLLTAIGGQVTIGDLEQMLFDHFRSWVVVTMYAHLHSITKKFGKLAPQTLETIFSLAMLYKYYGRQKYIEVLLLEERDNDDESASMDRLKSMVNLAVVHGEQEMFEEAEGLYRECFNKLKNAPGNNEVVLAVLNNLGLLYEAQEKYEEAEELFFKCYENRKRILGHDSQDTLRSMHLLARVYRKRGEYKKAEVLGFQCNERQQLNLGENHPDTADSCALLNAIKHEISI